jgi:hypothetical protein
LTGIPATGVFGVAAHAASGLAVAPTDGMHLSDTGHEVACAKYLDDLARKAPQDTRSIVASQRHRGSYANRDKWKEPVRVAAPVGVNVPIATPPTTLDGVTLQRNDRILLPYQTVPAENGIYRYYGGAPPLVRDSDANGNGKLSDGVTLSVCEGVTNADTDWTLVTNNPIVVGVTVQRWTRILPASGPLALRSPWNPTPTVGGGTLTQLRGLSLERNIPLANLTALLTGRIVVAGLFVAPAGGTVTNVAFASGATAASVPTAQWAGVCDLNRVLKGVSADRTTEAWGAYVWKQFPLVAPWTPDVDTPFLIVASVSATTAVPTLSGVAHSSASQVWTPVHVATGATVATPPANGSTLGAFTAAVNHVLCGWS